jgi:prophage antirepressor-like protein
MKDLIFVKQEDFGKLPCNFYQKDEEFYMTRQQIGEALEYIDPRVAITKIHKRHKDRLDLFSTVTKLVTVEGDRVVERDTIVYSLKGVFEICRWSNQPKANAFMDWVWDIMHGLLIRCRERQAKELEMK